MIIKKWYLYRSKAAAVSEREEHVVHGGCKQTSLGTWSIGVEGLLVGEHRPRRGRRGAR